MDERFLRPAILPDEAVDVPAIERERIEDEQKIGTTPAVSTYEQSRGYASSTSEHPSVLRVRMRQAAAAKDLVRGSNVQWSTRSVKETESSVHTPAIRQVSPSGQPAPTGIVDSESVIDMPAMAPMEHVLRGTVKRMVAQSGEYMSPRMRHTQRTKSVMEVVRSSPVVTGEVKRIRESNSLSTLKERSTKEHSTKEAFEFIIADNKDKSPVDVVSQIIDTKPVEMTEIETSISQ